MEPVFAAAKRAPKCVVYAEGEDKRVLRAAQTAVDEGIARPLLVGRADIMAARIQKLGLRLKLGDSCDGINILNDPRHREYGLEYCQLVCCKGVSRAQAVAAMRSQPTLVGAMLVRRGDTDTMLCGTRGNYTDHLKHVRDVIGLRPGVKTLAALQMLILPGRQLFICDTHVNRDPVRMSWPR
jgi:malate dehydrogenase (oxaloacetate-decarboxylating)(NADP+)